MFRTGRFAPSPTGDLHFGSLIAAVASYMQAKSAGGRWLIRIEDIDPPREVAGSANRILQDLQRFGLLPDQPVLYQSDRTEAYGKAIQQLLDQDQAYWCGCSRSELPSSGIYPGTCSRGIPVGKSRRSVRLRANEELITFTDMIQGFIQENLAESAGDFIIRRADGLAAYQLAVVLDDDYQGVTEVVRGSDLLGSTARQIHLQNCLGLSTPGYAHHPVAIGKDGRKLSKRVGSDPIAITDTCRVLELALEFLGQPYPPGLNLTGLLNWALENWQLERIPRTTFTL